MYGLQTSGKLVKERCKKPTRDMVIFIKKACVQHTYSRSDSGLHTILAWNKKLQALNLDRLWLYFKLFLYLIRSLVNSGREANFKDRVLREFCAENSLIHPIRKILQNV